MITKTAQVGGNNVSSCIHCLQHSHCYTLTGGSVWQWDMKTRASPTVVADQFTPSTCAPAIIGVMNRGAWGGRRGPCLALLL